MKTKTIRDSVPAKEIGAYMQRWADKRPNDVTVEVYGQTGEYDIYCAVFTDRSVSDENKQVAFITAQHAMEISGANSVMSLGNYLAAGKGRTDEILRNLIVVLVPFPNPWTFATQDPEGNFRNAFGVDEYGAGFTYHGAKDDGRFPAAMALQKLLDKYKPDLFLDNHGTTWNYQLVMPTLSYSGWGNNRLYNESINRDIQKAGSAVGQGTSNNDMIELCFQTDKQCADPEYQSRFRFTFEGREVASNYLYHQYHTLAASTEIGCEEEACARLVRALEIGCEKQPLEYYAGYPTRTVANSGHNQLRACGTTAAQRRKSRIELWQKVKNITFTLAHNEYPGFSAAIISTNPEKANKICPAFYTPMDTLAENMRGIPGVNADNMLEAFANENEVFAHMWPQSGVGCKIENGMTVRMALPFASAKVKKVMYNGNELSLSETDGYTVTEANNWVLVDVNVAPEKVADFAIVTVSYDCDVPYDGIIEY